MIWIAAQVAWPAAAALLGGLVALMLNKRVPAWSVTKRVLVSVAASTFPSFGIVGFFMAKLGLISLWFSPDEFLNSFSLHILTIIGVSTPIAWLVSRRVPRKPVPTDVFD